MGLFDDLIPKQSERAPIPAVGRALLDTIAGSESPGYNTMYGGGQFEGYADHPRKPVPITSGPNAGKTSSAAGRYQFLGSTWDEVKREAGLPDFSPESQDAGAWHLANKTYKTKTGRDLTADLEKAQGNPQAIAGIGRYLSGTWTSLPGGIEPNHATGSFAQRYDGARSTDMSSQARRQVGLFDDLLPPAASSSSPQAPSPPAEALADTGGRFIDEPGQNFRTAREGVSAPLAAKAAEGASAGAAPPAAVMDRLVQIWENPPKDKVSLIGMIKAAYEGATLPGDVAAGKVQVTGEDGRINPDVIERSAKLAAASPLASAPGGMLAAGAAQRVIPQMAPKLEANTAARNIGVDLPRAIGTDSSITKFMGQVANRMPGGGPMREGIETAVRQTGDAVGAAVEKAGGAADAMSAGQGFKSGIETYFKPTIKKRIGEAYDEVDKLVDLNATRPLSATRAAVDDIVARRFASGEADPGKAVKTVFGGIERPEGLTYAGVKDLRTRVGEMLDTGVFPEGMSQGELRRIYGTLSDDLKATVAATGGDKATAAFNRANAMNKFAEEWKDNIAKALGSDRSGEGISTALVRMASNGPTGDLKALTMARAAVPKEAWQDVASTAISRLGVNRKGEFDPAIFLNDFAKLSDRGKTLLFKDVGSGDVLPHLNDIASVSKKFIEAGKLANTSGTAGHGAAMTMMGGSAAGFLTGSLIEPVTAISVVVGNNLMARALSKPASAAAVARWTRAYEALAKKPEPRSMAAFNLASRNLANTLNGQIGSRAQPADFLKAIQAPATGRAEDNQ